MGKQYTEISDKHRDFIAAQKLFFVATAAAGTRINLSPKGGDYLRILDSNRVIWLNLTGSGNETAAHLLEDGRMTIMFCAFEGDPKILRLYGQAEAIHPNESAWKEYAHHFPDHLGARQIIVMQVDLVNTSCGFGVPLYNYLGEREEMDNWTLKKGESGIAEWWQKRNSVSLDGRPTGIPDKED